MTGPSFRQGSSCLLAIVLATIAGCAALPEHDAAETNADVVAAAGEPIRSIYVGRFIRDWQVIDRDTIRLDLDRGRRFLVRLGPPCSSVIDEVTTIELLANPGSHLRVFDQVRAGDMLCRVEEIRPVEDSASDSGTTE